jgi:hypothetical protein
MENDILWR